MSSSPGVVSNHRLSRPDPPRDPPRVLQDLASLFRRDLRLAEQKAISLPHHGFDGGMADREKLLSSAYFYGGRTETD